MPIYAQARLPDGRDVRIDADVLDIGRKLREGEPTLGWGGDPAASLVFNEDRNCFEVLGQDLMGRTYVMASHPKCDERLLVKCRDGHWSKAKDIIDRLVDDQAARYQQAQDALSEAIREEYAPRLATTILRSNGSRDMWGFGD